MLRHLSHARVAQGPRSSPDRHRKHRLRRHHIVHHVFSVIACFVPAVLSGSVVWAPIAFFIKGFQKVAERGDLARPAEFCQILAFGALCPERPWSYFQGFAEAAGRAPCRAREVT